VVRSLVAQAVLLKQHLQYYMINCMQDVHADYTAHCITTKQTVFKYVSVNTLTILYELWHCSYWYCEVRTEQNTVALSTAHSAIAFALLSCSL
jgi:hypothetical protein